MAVKNEFEAVTDFEDWYTEYKVEPDGCLWYRGMSKHAKKLDDKLQYYKREADQRLVNYYKYEKVADAAVVNERKDLPNVSSGDAAGFLRRIGRNVVQHTPNVGITSIHDDDSTAGIMADYVARAKVIGDDEYSNDMQQHLKASFIRSLALGFDCVIPVLEQDRNGSWRMQYDNINFRDVWVEPGAKDIRRAHEVFIRRYLTRAEVHHLIRSQAVGWDIAALKRLLKEAPISREYTDAQSRKHHVNTESYEIVTFYTDSGDPFLTFHRQSKILLRIEKNKHPLKEHPVFFLVPDYDGFQPYGRSLISLIYGRNEFQDLFLNGAIKQWRLNIEPPIITYGAANAIPNIGPNKLTQISRPDARVEAFEINTQSLMMFNSIAQGNSGNMAQMIGAADQQMAAQNTGGMMSQTPQGVDAQQQMVDTTTNDYTKALESFFSKYTSYALTIYFQELKRQKEFTVTADVRQKLVGKNLDPSLFDDKGVLHLDFEPLAVEYWVKVVPGSFTELEDEKQIRILQNLLVPISQALPAIAQSGDQEALTKTVNAIGFIIEKQIAMSDSKHATEIEQILKTGRTDASRAFDDRAAGMEDRISGNEALVSETLDTQNQRMDQLAEKISIIADTQARLLELQGVQVPPTALSVG